MAVKFPDILEHENVNYAIVSADQIRGISVVNSLTDRNNIPSNKRLLGSIVSVINDSVYQYRGLSISDVNWVNTVNWRSLTVGGTNNFVQYFQLTTDISSICNISYQFVCCVQTGQIYKYNPSASSYTVDGYYVLNTKDGGDSRFISLNYNLDIRSHQETISCNGVTTNYIITHNLNVKYVDLRCFDAITDERVEIYYKPIDYNSALIVFDTPVPNLDFIIVVKQ